MFGKKSAPQVKKQWQNDTLESAVKEVGKIGSGARSSFTSNLLKDGSKDFIRQLLGLGGTHAEEKGAEHQKSGSNPVEVFNSSKTKQKTENSPAKRPEKARVEPAINYHREITEAGKNLTGKEMQAMSGNIREIMVELKRLIDSSNALKSQFAIVAVEQAPVNPGKYHQNFFEWMLIMIRQARQKVEDSGAWLQTAKGKGGKKKKYSDFGSNYHLSGERTTATQTG